MKASSVILVLCIAILGTSGICNAGWHQKKFQKRPCHARETCIDGDDGGLKMDYYKDDCPQVEEIVRNITWKHVSVNSTLAAKLLRIHYHDCFVRGCDASILIDSLGNNKAEKEAIQNRLLTGYEVIEEIKSKLEDECPERVSCADIVALVARDAVSFQFRFLRKQLWEVPTGRKDGRVSLSSEVSSSLPSPFANFSSLLQTFEDHDLDIIDLVTLSGAHTLGVTHCTLISKRLYNFTGKGDMDPSLDPDYAEHLKTICPVPIDPGTTLDMDPGSSSSFDSHYFMALQRNMTAFSSDSALLTNRQTANLARDFQDFGTFLRYFRVSMKKMGAIGVLKDGQGGEIRKNCTVINP